MTQQIIGIGTTANDGTGDTPRAAGGKLNANFAELYAALGTGAPFVGFSVNQFRLSTQTGTPVTMADRAAQSTLYLTPANGPRIGLYNGTIWVVPQLAEASLALTGLTALTIYDVFAYLTTGGALALELSAPYSGNTPSDVVAPLNGVPVKQSNNTRRYVGTIRTASATTVDDTKQHRWVWNAYNQVPRTCSKAQTVDNHTYTSSTWREWDNGTNGPHRFSFVTGAAQSFTVNGYAEMGPANAGNVAYICLSLNVVAESPVSASNANTVITRCGLSGGFDSIVGFNELVIVEATTNGTSSTFNQYVIGSLIQG